MVSTVLLNLSENSEKITVSLDRDKVICFG